MSLVGFHYVDDLRKGIKKESPHTLEGYDAAALTIKVTINDKDPKNAEELDSEEYVKRALERVWRQHSPVGSSGKKIRFFVFLPRGK